MGNEINRTRMVFTFGIEQGLIGKPILFGNFKRTDKMTLRKHRARQKVLHGPRMYERDEILKLLAAATQPMKAMILLGINCGFGNMDVATLPLAALNPGRRLGHLPASQNWHRAYVPALPL